MSTVGYVDTTLRDLTTFPWGSGVDADDIAVVSAALKNCNAHALEVVDPRVAKAALELRTESPWDRIRAVVRHAGRTPVGVVVHGRLLWGAHPVADDVLRQFVACAAENGVRRIRSLDPLNNPAHMETLGEACRGAGITFVPSLVTGPAPALSDERWSEEARALAQLPGTDALCISDGGGHLSPTQLAELVQRVAAATDLPIEVVVQAPGGLAPLMAEAAVDAGARVVHASIGPAALVTARPSVETVRAALVGGDNVLGCDRAGVAEVTRVISTMITSDRLSQGAVAVFGAAVALPPDLEVGLMTRLSRVGMSPTLPEVSDEAARIAAELGNLTFAFPLGDAIVAQAAQHVISGERWATMEPVLVAALAGEFGPLRGQVSEQAAEAATETERRGMPEGAPPIDPGAQLSEEDRVLWAQFPDDTARLTERRRSLRGEAPEESGAEINRALLDTLIQAVEASDEAEVCVEVGDARVTVRRHVPSTAPVPGAPGAPAGAGDGLTRVESIMVGTFYRASSPEADPFCEVGQRVDKGQALCLIEAMKLFNEITAPCAGVIREIAVQNAEGVEFGQLLFLIEPS